MSVWNTVLPLLAAFVNYAVLAIFAQNAVFGRALGVSRLVKLVDSSPTGTVVFCALLCSVQILAAPVAWYAFQYMQNAPGLSAVFRGASRPLVYLTSSAAAFCLVWLVCCLLPLPKSWDIRKILPQATFNSCVLGTLLICISQSYTLPQTIGFSVGSAFGYLLAVLLVDEADRRLHSRAVPTVFKGLPITLIYIGILSMAIYGLSGHSLTI